MKRIISILLCIALGFSAGCMTQAQLKQTSINLAQPAGYAVAQWVYTNKPKLAATLLPDVEALLNDALTSNAPLLSSDVTKWVNAEAAKGGLSDTDVANLDNLILTQIVLLQSQFQQDVTGKLGVTATAILTKFNLGLQQASALQPK